MGQVFTSACRGEGENERAFSLIADGERVTRRRPHMLSGGERTGTRIAISGSERGGEERTGAGGKQGQIQIQQVQLTEGRGEQTGSKGN